jgi:hypothetical protein
MSDAPQDNTIALCAVLAASAVDSCRDEKTNSHPTGATDARPIWPSAIHGS